jgi:hypothetical protein
MIGICARCGREERLTRRHSKQNEREFDRELVKEAVGLCRSCQAQVHGLSAG